MRYGRQRWKLKGRIEVNSRQSWDGEEMIFMPLISDLINIKVLWKFRHPTFVPKTLYFSKWRWCKAKKRTFRKSGMQHTEVCFSFTNKINQVVDKQKINKFNDWLIFSNHKWHILFVSSSVVNIFIWCTLCHVIFWSFGLLLTIAMGIFSFFQTCKID